MFTVREWAPVGYLLLAVVLVAGWALFLDRDAGGLGSATACDEVASISGMPICLCRGELSALETLKLPRSVDDISWLPPSVEELDIEELDLSELRGLPRGTSRIHAAATSIVSVASLEGVAELDLSRSALPSIEALPPSSTLTSLKLSDLDVRGLAKRFPELRRLSIELQVREMLDLSELPRGLTFLSLTGSLKGGVRSLEGVPDGLQELHLSVSSTQLVDLPSSLRRLSILGPVVFDPEELPSGVTDLQLVEYRPRRPLADLFPYLTSLEIRHVPVYSADELPRFLSRLTLERTALTSPFVSLPSGLTFLSITEPEFADFTAIQALQHLEHLVLSRWNGAVLPALPSSIRRLDLPWAKVKSIAEIPRSVAELDLSWTGVDPAELTSRHGLRSLVWHGYPESELVDLPVSLLSLDISDSPTLQRIGRLPPNLVELDLGYTGLDSLPEALPPSLRVLRARGVPLLRWESLPPLTTLVITASEAAGCPPRTLKTLEIHDR